MWTEQERPFKALARDVYFSAVGRRKCVLHFPGRDCECLKAGLKANAFSPATLVTLVERDPDVIPHIKKFLAAHWPKGWRTPRIHEGEFSTLHLSDPLDAAYIDLLGNLTRWDCLKLRQFDYAPSADLAFTINFSPRGNVFIRHCIARMKTFKTVLCEKTARLTGYPMDMRLFLATYMTLFENILFTDYKFTVAIDYYNDDGNTMFLFRLGRMYRIPASEQTGPDAELMNSFFGAIDMKTKKKPATIKGDFRPLEVEKSYPTYHYDPVVRHQAALKAAATRRANIAAAERLAAIKARKRAKAAKKGWEVRRANAA